MKVSSRFSRVRCKTLSIRSPLLLPATLFLVLRGGSDAANLFGIINDNHCRRLFQDITFKRW